jgi:hypothetical protein
MSRIRNPETADLICSKIADGYTLRQIAKIIDCEASAITCWVRQDDEFATQYARAREIQAELFGDELIEIADDGSNDWMEREGVVVADHEHIQRSKLRCDNRKWLMSKMLPKKYGDRVVNEHTGADGGPIKIESKVEVLALLAGAFDALPPPTIEHDADEGKG